jgi:trehalose 6-phosphate phosphatase
MTTALKPPPLTSDVALFLDFDGTIVEIASSPNDIRVAAGLGKQLQHVAWLLNGALAVISGRPIAAIDHYLGDTVHCVAGIHGAERRTPLGHVNRAAIDADVLAPFRAKLNTFSRTHGHVLIEDKSVSIAVHYRDAPGLADACHRIVDECVADSHGQLERLDGKMVVELKPAAVTKVEALTHYMNEAPFAGRRPVFVGDDITDEAAFAEVSKTNGYGVIVGDRTPTAATSRLVSVDELHRWLQVFCDQTDGDRQSA